MACLMAGVTLEELLKEVGVVPATLAERCSDDHLNNISLFLDWQTVAPHLGLSETDQREIESSGQKDPGKRLKTLVKWKAKFGFKATYRRLIEVLLIIDRADHAEEVCKLLRGSSTTAYTVSDGAVGTAPPLPESPLPYNKTSSVDTPCTIIEAPQTSLPACVEGEIVVMEKEYEDLVFEATKDIGQSIKAGKVELTRVKKSITLLPVSIRHHHVKFLAGKLKDINEAKDIHELISILDLYWDFMNCGLLKRLVNRFGSPKTQLMMEKYLERLNEFRMKTTVREFTGKWTGQTPPNMSGLTMEMKDEWKDNQLDAVERLRAQLPPLESYALRFKESRHSSVILCFALQRSFPMSAEILQPARQFLQEQGVLRVFFKGVCLLDLRPPQVIPNIKPEDATSGSDIPTISIGTTPEQTPFMTAIHTVDSEQRIIAEVMKENGVSMDDIPVESPFVPSRPSQTDESKRYFHVKGFAWFKEHNNDNENTDKNDDEASSKCTRTWPSAHAWCIMDLKEQQIVKRYPQKCPKCEGSALSEFDEEALRRMTMYALKSYYSMRIEKLNRELHSGNALDHGGRQPHDEARCSMCQGLGRSCWD